MIRNNKILKNVFRVKPDTVIHVGAHLGQDRHNYIVLGAKKIIWGEASPNSAKLIREKYPDDEVIERIFWEAPNVEISFYSFSESEKNSAIAPIDLEFASITVGRSTTLDELFENRIFARPIMLVLDVQGAEIHVLRGARKALNAVDYVVVEIANENQGYVETPTEEEIDQLMNDQGLRKSLFRNSHDKTYKDQLYMRHGLLAHYCFEICDSLILKIRKSVHFLKNKHFPDSNHDCENCRNVG
jgi:FkbM family methyltransferase